MRFIIGIFCLLCFEVSVNAQSFTMTMPSINANCGEIIEIPITISGFKNLLSLQGTIGWDSKKLKFLNISSFGPPSLDLDIGNFGTNNSEKGILTFSWIDKNLEGKSLSDSTIIFKIRLSSTSYINETIDIQFLNSPLTFEIIDIGYNQILSRLINGFVNLKCNSLNSINLILPDFSTSCNTTLEVPIKVKDFKNIISFQGSLNWNSDLLQFQSISSFGNTLIGLNNSNFGLNNISNGKLSFSWNDYDLTGKNLTDSSVLFTMRFFVNGNNSSSTSIEFSNTPTMIEVNDNKFTTLRANIINSKIDISCKTSNKFELIAPTIHVNCNAVIELPITVRNYNKIFSFQGSIIWDTSLLKFKSVLTQSSNQLGLSESNFGLNNASNGKLTFSWNDNNLSGKSLGDSSTLFIIRFSTLGSNGKIATLNFNDIPTKIEIINTSLQSIDYNLISGSCIFDCIGKVYTFIGNGNWDIISNWLDNLIPPSVLQSGDQIIINPIQNGECILNIKQTIPAGSTIKINTGKKIRILSDFYIQQ
jgi:hypothetical protein